MNGGVPSGESGFYKVFSARNVSIALRARSRDEVLSELTDLLVSAGDLPADRRDQVLDLLREREKVGSTGIGSGVAIPHIKTDLVARTIAAVGVAGEPIDFKAVDGEPCDVFVMLLSPHQAAANHLALLRWLSKLVRGADFCRFLRGAKSGREAAALFKEMGE